MERVFAIGQIKYNNIIHSLKKETPFFANYSHYPWADFFQIKNIGSNTIEELATHLAIIYNKHTF